MRRETHCISLGVLALLALLASTCLAASNPVDWSSVGLSSGLKPCAVVSTRDWGAWRGPSPAERRLRARCGTLQIRVEAASGLSSPAARAREKQEFSRVAMLFEGSAAYPGDLTRRFTAPAELRPRNLEAGPGGRRTLLLPATAELTYGAGSADLVAYDAAMTMLRCPSGILVKVEAFVKPSSAGPEPLLSALGSFSCAAPR